MTFTSTSNILVFMLVFRSEPLFLFILNFENFLEKYHRRYYQIESWTWLPFLRCYATISIIVQDKVSTMMSSGQKNPYHYIVLLLHIVENCFRTTPLNMCIVTTQILYKYHSISKGNIILLKPQAHARPYNGACDLC